MFPMLTSRPRPARIPRTANADRRYLLDRSRAIQHHICMNRTNDGMADLVRACASLNFGGITPEGGELEFYRALNGEMITFVKSLPASMQSEAMLFSMRYAGIRIGEELDFFHNYHAPVWSVIYWTAAGRIAPGIMRDGITAHAMAMLLHSLDDHLADGELPATHLTLLIRSQAWHLMQETLARYGGALNGGPDAAAGIMDEYYAAIGDSNAPDTIGEYCARFRKQMATGLIVPHLTAMHASGGPVLAGIVRSAGECFGVAWRLLDDIQDLGKDIRRGRRTAIYCLLPEEGRVLWDGICSDTGACAVNDGLSRLDGIIREAGIIGSAVGIMSNELVQAAALAGEAGLDGLAEEYRILMEPLLGWVPE